jgi:hypothetical protein
MSMITTDLASLKLSQAWEFRTLDGGLAGVIHPNMGFKFEFHTSEAIKMASILLGEQNYHDEEGTHGHVISAHIGFGTYLRLMVLPTIGVKIFVESEFEDWYIGTYKMLNFFGVTIHDGWASSSDFKAFDPTEGISAG